MGQKINPTGFRLGVIRDWEAKWYADRGYKETLNEDLRIRKYISKRLKDASVSTVEIERAANRINISIHTAKPGMVIGKGGSEVEALRKELNKLTDKQVHINIVEIKKPDLDAKLVADGIARQLEARIAFRRATRQATQRSMRAGAEGIRVQTSGRLNGADMARREWHTEGRVPLQTLRADIDYAWVNAFTTYGEIGVQVWINRGEVLPGRKNKPNSKRAKGGNK
jgi:small subunit ribosomal protein S3